MKDDIIKERYSDEAVARLNQLDKNYKDVGQLFCNIAEEILEADIQNNHRQIFAAILQTERRLSYELPTETKVNLYAKIGNK